MVSQLRGFGFAALGFAAAGAAAAIVVAVQLFVRGVEVDQAGTSGFITTAETILVFGGAAAAVVGAVIGPILVRRSAASTPSIRG